MPDMWERWQNSQKKRKQQKLAKTSNTTSIGTKKEFSFDSGLKIEERCSKKVNTGTSLAMPCVLEKEHSGKCRWKRDGGYE